MSETNTGVTTEEARSTLKSGTRFLQNTRRRNGEQIDPEAVRMVVSAYEQAFGGSREGLAATSVELANRAAALEAKDAECEKLKTEVAETREATKKVLAQASEQPRPSWVVSGRRSILVNGIQRDVVFTTPTGTEFGRINCSAVPPGIPDVVSPLSLALTDASGAFYLGGLADEDGFLPLMAAHEVVALAVELDKPFEGMGEIKATDSASHRTFSCYAEKALAERVKRNLLDGEHVKLKVADRRALEIVDADDVAAKPQWYVNVGTEGLTLDQMVFSRSVRKAWSYTVWRDAHGKSVRLLLHGPTGCGKTSAVWAFARQRSARLGIDPGLVCIGSQYTGSSLYTETEQNIANAIRWAAANGYAVLLDECEGMLGLTHYESSTEARVRAAITDMLSEYPDTPVFLTMNVRSSISIPETIDRRLVKIKYGRPTFRQVSKVVSLFVSDATLAHVEMNRAEFGATVAQFVFSDDFHVATLVWRSGRRDALTARSIKSVTSPGKCRELVERFNDQLEYRGTLSIGDLYGDISREAMSAPLTEKNVHDYTYVPKVHDDEVVAVEMISAERNATGGPRAVVTRSA